MKNLYYSDIYDYVKAKMDELSNNDDANLVVSDSAVEDLEKEIDAAILPAVRKIHLDAPNVLLRDGVEFDKDSTPYSELADNDSTELVVEPQTLIFSAEGGTQNVLVYTDPTWTVSVTEGSRSTTYDSGTYKFVMQLPSDFLRLITLQMSDWVRPIQTLINEDSAEYRKQANKYLRGTYTKPVGAIVHRWPGGDYIELYSCRSTAASLTYGQYVPEPETKTNATYGDYVLICEPLRDACLNQVTANVLRGYGRAQEAALYDRLAVQPFYIDPDYARLNPPMGERFNTINQ